MTKRKIRLGIVFTYILIFIQVLWALTFLLKLSAENYDDKKEIKGLRPYVIALIIGFIITLIGGIYAEYNRGFEIYGVLNLILAIPNFFIIGYFNKMKTEIEKM